MPLEADPAASSPAWSMDGGASDPLDAAPMSAPGTGPRYLYGASVGAGAMGVVVVAWDPLLQRHIAIKTANAAHPTSAARLRREAALLAQLPHPAIVPVFDSGEGADGTPWLAMRLVDGKTLAQLLAELSRGSATAALLRALLQVCQGIAHAHSRGVLHRDLKPANILVDAQNGVQIIDWGLACRTSDGRSALLETEDVPASAAQTASGAVLGTPTHMSPEAARGEALSTRSDVFSLGAMLYEVATGQPLRPAASATETLRLAQQPTSVAWPDPCDPELVAIVACCLQDDPDRRYKDAGALADDLAAYLDGRRVSVHAYSPGQLLRRLVTAWRLPLSIAALAALLLAIGVGFAAQQVVHERDRAQSAERDARQALVESQRARAQLATREAVALAQRSAWSEAAVLAAHALALGADETASVDARGVLVAAAGAPAIAAHATLVLPTCHRRYLDRDANWLLCLEGTSASLWSLHPVRALWRVPQQSDYGVVVAEPPTVWLRSPGRLQAFDLHTGAWLASGLPASATVPIVPTDSGEVAQVSAGGIVITARNGAQRQRTICPGDAVVSALWADADGFLGACGDGRIYACPYAGDCSATAMLSVPARDVTAVARYRAHTWFATARGQVAVCDPGVAACNAPVELVHGMVRRLAVVGPWLLALGDRGEWVLAAATSLEPVLRSSLGAPTDAQLAPKHLHIAADHLRSFALPSASELGLLSVPAGASLASFDVCGTRVALGLNTGWVVDRPLSAQGPITAWQLANGVVKTVACDATGGWTVASSTARSHAVLRRGDAVAELPYHNFRRLARVRDDHREWLVGATYFSGTVAWRPEAPVEDAAHLVAPAGDAWLDLAATADRRAVLGIGAATGSVARWQPSASLQVLTVDKRWRHVAAGRAQGGFAVGDEQWIAWHGQLGPPTATAHSPAQLCDLAVSRDERWLAAGLIDGSVMVYALPSATATARSRLQRERVAELQFSSEGNLLWAGSWDGTLRRLGLAPLERSPSALAAETTRRWQLTPAQLR